MCLITFTLTKHPFSMGLKGFYEQAPRHQSAGKSTDPGAVRRRTATPATGVSSRSPRGSPQDGKPWRWVLLALKETCLNLLPQEASHDLALHECLQKQGKGDESLLALAHGSGHCGPSNSESACHPNSWGTRINSAPLPQDCCSLPTPLLAFSKLNVPKCTPYSMALTPLLSPCCQPLLGLGHGHTNIHHHQPPPPLEWELGEGEALQSH